MKKKNNLPAFKFRIGILLILAGVCIAQSPSLGTDPLKGASQEPAKTGCSKEKIVMPPTFDKDRRGFTDFLAIMSAPESTRAAEFSKLAPEAAALVLRLHLSWQAIKRDLSSDQRSLILRTISSVSSEMYSGNVSSEAKARSKEFQRNASSLFSRREIFEIFSSISGKLEDVSFIQQYEELLETSITNRKLQFIDGSPSERRDLLIAQSVYYLATSNLGDEQGIVYFKIVDALTPKALAGPFKETILINEDAARLFELKTAAEAVFSKSETFLYFSSLGAHKVDIEAEKRTTESSVAAGGTCNCNYACALCFECYDPSDGCTQSRAGCGWILLDPCDSKCRFNSSYCY